MKVVERKRKIEQGGSFPKSKFSAVFNSTFFEVLSSQIYTYKVRAIVRELSCNAYDIHDDCGYPERKFDVNCPTFLDKHFVVRDYGSGLTDAQVRGEYVCENCGHTERPDKKHYFCAVCNGEMEFSPGVYNTYFLSTKRDSETATGCLGLGTKSPFSLSDSFLVESFIDGMHRTYKCYMDEDNEPAVALLTEIETDEPNGLKVTVNVKDNDIYKYKDECVRVFQHFNTIPNVNDETILEKIEQKKSQYVIEGDGYKFTGRNGQTYAVMANVAYAIPREYISLEGYIEFESGSLNFNPGREQLSIDEHTESSLKKRIERVESDLGYNIFKSLRKLPTKFERASKLEDFKVGIFGKLDWEIKDRLNCFKMPVMKDNKITVYDYSGSFTVDEMPVDITEDIRYFRVGEDGSVRGYVTRIKKWLKRRRARKIVLVKPSHIKECEIPSSVLEDLDELPEIEKTRSYVRQTERVFSWKNPFYPETRGRRRNENWEAEDVDINDGVTRLYVEIKYYEPVGFKDCHDFKAYFSMLKDQFGDIKVYGIKSALVKQKQFKESSFVPLKEWANRKIEENKPKIYYTAPSTSTYDSMIKKLADETGYDLFVEYEMYLEEISNQMPKKLLGDMYDEIPKDDSADKVLEEILDTYPLFRNLRSATAHGSSLKNLCEYVRLINNENKVSSTNT